jgi:hypothetical protein
MRKQYLHLSAYTCDMCAGPVIAGSLGVRENEISKETEISLVGALCLSCGHRQDKASGAGRPRYFFPIEWEPVSLVGEAPIKSAVGEGIPSRRPVLSDKQ